MDRLMRGKCLVRKSKTSNGDDVITLTGVFYPTNFTVDEIEITDEMWVCDVNVMSGGLRFTQPVCNDGGSPEDFLSGNMQSPRSWVNKTKL